MSKFKLTTTLANEIAHTIANATDANGQIVSMRETLMRLYKGAPAQVLGDDETAMLRDAFKRDYGSRKTMKKESVDVAVTNATKVARCMPVILTAEGKVRDEIAGSWDALKRISTQVQKHETLKAALVEFRKKAAEKEAGKKDYKKSSASHFKAILGMKDGKFWTPKQRGAIVECAALCGIEL